MQLTPIRFQQSWFAETSSMQGTDKEGSARVFATCACRYNAHNQPGSTRHLAKCGQWPCRLYLSAGRDCRPAAAAHPCCGWQYRRPLLIAKPLSSCCHWQTCGTSAAAVVIADTTPMSRCCRCISSACMMTNAIILCTVLQPHRLCAHSGTASMT